MTNAGGLGDVVNDPDEAIRRVDEWAAGLARKSERYVAAQQETAQLRLTAASPDGAVRVSVGADGVVTDLTFGERISSMRPEELGPLVLSTMRRAQADIAGRVAEVYERQIGDADPETRTLLLDSLTDRFPEQEEPEPPPPPEAPPGRGRGLGRLEEQDDGDH